MVIMALDHVRDFFHIDALRFDPTDLTQTSVVLFLTRFVTHFCAPTFVFLSGASVWFQRARGKALPDLSRFLLTRGLWLIVLELTLVSFAIGLKPGLLFLQVIWCIGLGMVLLAGLVWIPRAAVLALGAAIVAGHGLLAAVDPERLGALAPVLALAIRPNLIPLAVPNWPICERHLVEQARARPRAGRPSIARPSWRRECRTPSSGDGAGCRAPSSGSPPCWGYRSARRR
jgi:hypothetical protein